MGGDRAHPDPGSRSPSTAWKSSGGGSKPHRTTAQTGTDLAGGLDGTRDAVANALSALGSVRDLLASYSFVEV